MGRRRAARTTQVREDTRRRDGKAPRMGWPARTQCESERRSPRCPAYRELQLPAASLPDTDCGCETRCRLWTNPRRRQLLPENRAAGYTQECALSRECDFCGEVFALQRVFVSPQYVPTEGRIALRPKSRALRTTCRAARRTCEPRTISAQAHSNTPLRAAGKSCTPGASARALHWPFAE